MSLLSGKVLLSLALNNQVVNSYCPISFIIAPLGPGPPKNVLMAPQGERTIFPKLSWWADQPRSPSLSFSILLFIVIHIMYMPLDMPTLLPRWKVEGLIIYLFLISRFNSVLSRAYCAKFGCQSSPVARIKHNTYFPVSAPWLCGIKWKGTHDPLVNITFLQNVISG